MKDMFMCGYHTLSLYGALVQTVPKPLGTRPEKTDCGKGHLTEHVSEQPALAAWASYCTSTIFDTDPAEGFHVL